MNIKRRTPLNGGKTMNRAAIVIRIVATVAAIAVVAVWALNAQDFIRDFNRGPWETSFFFFYLAVTVLPSFIVVLLVAFGRFWWAFGIGLWLLVVAIITACVNHASIASMLLVLATAMVCTTPFLNRACRNKTPSTSEADTAR